MAVHKITKSLPRSDSLSAELKSIINHKNYTKWNGKVFSRQPRILIKMMESIKAAWEMKSFSPETVRKQLLLREVARTVNIIKTMKDQLPANPTLDAKQAKALINETQAKVLRLVNALNLVSDTKIEPWIEDQKGILEMFSDDLTHLQIALPVISEKELKAFHKNLQNFTLIKPTKNHLHDVQNFQIRLLNALKKPLEPENEIKINEKTLLQVLPNIPDSRYRLLEIHQEKDPIKKLELFGYFLGKELLHDGFGLELNEIGADHLIPAIESILRKYPEESLLLIADILTNEDEELKDSVMQRAELAKDPKEQHKIQATYYTFISLISIILSVLSSNPDRM